MRFEALHRLKRDRGRNADRAHAVSRRALGAKSRAAFDAGFVDKTTGIFLTYWLTGQFIDLCADLGSTKCGLR
jgi:hypothetical protein